VVVNFRVRGVSRAAHKLDQIPILIIKKIRNDEEKKITKISFHKKKIQNKKVFLYGLQIKNHDSIARTITMKRIWA